MTPSFNQGRFLEKTIRSVLLQSYPEIEYIVVDGGSSDETLQVLRKYDPWIDQWVSEADEGQSDAINKGFRSASGELVNWLNCDDYLMPGALQKVAERFVANGGGCSIIGKCRWVDHRGKTLFEHAPREHDAASIAGCGENWIPQPSSFFPLQTFWDIGGLSLDLHYAMDFDMYVKLAQKLTFVPLDEVIACALIHSQAKTNAMRHKMYAEVRISQFRNGAEDSARKGLEKDYARLERFDRFTSPIRNSFLFRSLIVAAKRLMHKQ